MCRKIIEQGLENTSMTKDYVSTLISIHKLRKPFLVKLTPVLVIVFVVLTAFIAISCTPKVQTMVKADPSTAGGNHPESLKEKKEETKEILEKIYATIGTSRIWPSLSMVEDTSINMWYSSDENMVMLTEKMYDICEDNKDALAFLLGHELAHFYCLHGWTADFASHSECDFRKVVENVTAKQVDGYNEGQADHFGSFFAYLAGYDIQTVIEPILDLIYKELNLDVNAINYGYPKLEDRKSIAKQAIVLLQNDVAVFQAGIKLLTIGQYQQAQWCFDYLAKDYTSREIIMNAGVARVLQATKLFNSRDVRNYPWCQYDYPFVIASKSGTEGRNVRGFASTTENDKIKREKLIKEAWQLFIKSMLADFRYAPVYVNLACTSQLACYSLDETQPSSKDEGQLKDGNLLAEAFAKRAIELANGPDDLATLANAHIALGIAYANNLEPVKKKNAITEFDKALLNRGLAKKNKDKLIKILSRENPEILANITNVGSSETGEAKGEKGPYNITEKIDGIDPKKRDLVIMNGESVKMSRVPKVSNKQPELGIRSKVSPDEGKIKVEVLTIEYRQYKVNFVTALASYEGASGRGVKIGGSLESLEEVYGQAPRVITSRNRIYHCFPKARIIFEITPEKTVSGWTIYKVHR